jgi:undecaprenyl-diphosphatase
MTETIQAIILGIVEGLTEFLPVSSTGHLLIAKEMLGFNAVRGNAFEISIQVGAILAVCLLYYRKLTSVALTLHKSKKSQNFTIAVLVAFMPAVIVGLLIHGYMEEHFFNLQSIAISFILGGIAIILIEKYVKKPKIHDVDNINKKTALKIGLIQCLSMIPGTSRSGATIMGAMLAGVDRKAAAEFSFFLAIPTIIGATVLDLYKNWQELDASAIDLILVGGFVSFLTALVVVNKLVGFVSRNGFKPFAIYRIVAGIAIIGWMQLS